MDITLIFARSDNNQFGLNGKLPWHIPEDLEHFRTTTKGGIVVMGHNTWKSLPDAVRPLPDRHNVVMSRDKTLRLKGAFAANTMFNVVSWNVWQSMNYGKPVLPIFVIGGREVLTACMSMAKKLIVTTVHQDVEGDVEAPTFDFNLWDCTTSVTAFSSTGPEYTIDTYVKKPTDD